MSSKELLSLIEQFESSFDAYQQVLKKSEEEIVKQLSVAWKKLKNEEAENEKLIVKISEQNSKLTELRTTSEGLDTKIAELKAKKDELTSKNTELNNDFEKISNDLKKPQFELETLTSKLDTVNEKITSKETEKTTLDQKKIDNEHRDQELKETHTKRMENLSSKLNALKQSNFFTSFVMDNSEEEIHEVGILASIMETGSVKLEDLKKALDVPPIMAVRTIKQLALKGIINLDEDTNIVTMP